MMQYLKAVGTQLLGLFIVDARFTVALVVWIAASASTPLLFHGNHSIAGFVFFSGFAAILLENVMHTASSFRPT
jgi:hypothetical protein